MTDHPEWEAEWEAARKAWDARATRSQHKRLGNDSLTESELYEVYASWTGQLHFYCERVLGRHLDCEFFPSEHKFRLYSGRAQDAEIGGYGPLPSTVPGFVRPEGELAFSLDLPRAEAKPTQTDLDVVFLDLCRAAARVLEIDLGKSRLPEKHASDESHLVKRPRLRARKKQS